MNLVVCVCCGITDRDGAPEHGIPYPVVKERESGEILCDACHEEEQNPPPKAA